MWGDNMSGCIDSSTKTIDENDFQLMIDAVNGYIIAHNGTRPVNAFLYTDAKPTNDYFTYPKFQEMHARWDAFINAHGVKPAFVYINVAPNKPQLFLDLEQNLRCTINSMDDLINGVANSYNRNGSVYSHFPCLQGATIAYIVSGVNVKRNNCARWAYLAMYVAGVLGVSCKYIHVNCDYANHNTNYNAGHYLVYANGRYYDLAHAADQGSTTGTMCTYGFNYIIDNNEPC